MPAPIINNPRMSRANALPALMGNRHNSREPVNRDIPETLELIGETVGESHRPQSIAAGFWNQKQTGAQDHPIALTELTAQQQQLVGARCPERHAPAT